MRSSPKWSNCFYTNDGQLLSFQSLIPHDTQTQTLQCGTATSYNSFIFSALLTKQLTVWCTWIVHFILLPSSSIRIMLVHMMCILLNIFCKMFNNFPNWSNHQWTCIGNDGTIIDSFSNLLYRINRCKKHDVLHDSNHHL